MLLPPCAREGARSLTLLSNSADIGVAEPLYALSLFSPTIISELGTFSRAQSQLLSTPPYVLAFFITLATAIYSDRIQRRGIFNIFWMTVVIIGCAYTSDTSFHRVQD